MNLHWNVLLNDDTKFPRLLFFGDISDDRFRYGINTQLEYCLYFFFDTYGKNSPVEPFAGANISLEEKIEEGRPALVLTLLNDQGKNIFSDLITSIAFQIHPVKGMAAKSEFIKLCNEWFELFEPLSGQLTRAEIQGILAELIFLNYLLKYSKFQYNDILSAWKGPFGKGHDFELENNHFEIKGIAEFKDFVQISSEYQLDYLSGQRLFLGVIEFGSEPAMLTTIKETVDEIASLLRSVSGTNMSLFWAALGKAGLKYNSLQEYDHQLFAIKSMRFYNCNAPDFPSVKRSQLSDIISNVNYRLSLSGIQNYLEENITSFV